MFYNCSSLNSFPDISKWAPSKETNVNMMFLNCNFSEKIPDYSIQTQKFSFNTKTEIKDNENYKIVGPIRNENLNFIPQIEMKFNKFENHKTNSIYELKNEIKNILKNENCSIIEIKKGSLTVVLCLQYLMLKNIRIM